jgi:hypothetical protein
MIQQHVDHEMIRIQADFKTKFLGALFAKVSAHVGCAVDETGFFARGSGSYFRFHLVQQTTHTNKSLLVSQIRFTYTTHEMKRQAVNFILTLAVAQIFSACFAYNGL